MSMDNQSSKTLASIIPDAIIFLDKNMKISWWNPAAERLFSLTASHVNLAISKLIGSNELPLDSPDENQAFEFKLPDNPNKIIAASLFPYTNDKKIFLARDESHVSHLEKIRQDFIANVSHELRTPLTVIHGYLETLIDENDDKLLPWKGILNQMYHQSLRMEQLVNDLLLLSRLEDKKLDHSLYQPVNIGNMLKTIHRDALALSNNNHTIIINSDSDLCILGIEDELHSAFSNIIFNAVKYTPEKGTISISWSKENEKPVLTVKDTGIGIAAEHIPRLTERFYRADKARSRASGGTGLGLAIVKHVLIRHKAKLNITSTVGKGSLFKCLFNNKTMVKTR